MNKKISILISLISVCLMTCAFTCSKRTDPVNHIKAIVLFKQGGVDSIVITSKEDISKLYSLREYIAFDHELNDGRMIKMSEPSYTLKFDIGYSLLTTYYIWPSSVKEGGTWYKYNKKRDKNKVFSTIEKIIKKDTPKQ